MEKLILIKYGELTTKKDNRKLFINKLENNIKSLLKNYDIKIKKDRVRMYIVTSNESFGISKTLLTNVLLTLLITTS